MKNEVKKRGLILFFLAIAFVISSVSAGIGIKYDQESAMVEEGGKSCLTYSIYNPFPSDTYVMISVSPELKDILVLQEMESKLIPRETSSANAIPMEFCFEVPQVYQRDCSVGSFLCELKCEEENKVYDGEVIVSAAPAPASIGGTGGSTTQMSVSAPLRIRVECSVHPRDYTILYILIALLSAAVISWALFRKYRKPKVERDREKLKKLRAKIAKESGKRKK